MKQGQGALVVFSGGQDSTTCLFWALERFERVEAVTFDTGNAIAVKLSMRGRLPQNLG